MVAEPDERSDGPSGGPLALMRRAAGPGRVRGVGTDLWRRAKAQPEQAAAVFRSGLRAARMLHSNERRLVGDLLADLVRTGRGLAHVLGTDDADALWSAALLRRGLPADELPGAWDEAAWEALGATAEGRLRWWHGWPRWLAERLGLEEPELVAYAAATDQRAPVDLRVNRTRGTAAAAVAALAEDGVRAEPVGPWALRVVEGRGVEASAAWRDGLVEVQDLGSQRLGDLVGTEPTDVLDLCAGAGGKSLQLAAAGHRVVAADPRYRALDELQERARRAGATVRTVVADAGESNELRGRRFGAVLVDAPCTGTGTWRRAPTLRWTWSPEAEAEAAVRQRALLRAGARFVAPGGRLIYGTCSVSRVEDEAIADAFARDHEGWTRGEVLRTWPHRDGTDGFFGAVFTRPG